MRKKIDDRIRIIIENCQKTKHRGFFVIIGDRAREQVVNIHYLLTKLDIQTRKKILWCYKKELGFSSHKKKRMKEIQKLVKQGVYDSTIDEPFDVFVASTDIRYCYYKETQNILGSTYGLLVLQDFESITPNILCRTIETVEGGGLVFLLVKSMTSFRQLYTMTMDVHKRYRTEAHRDVEPRFNERFILSLTRAQNVIFMDDELNVLTISSQLEKIQAVTVKNIGYIQEAEAGEVEAQESELENLKNSLKENEIVGPLVGNAKTLDQAKAVMVFVDTLNEKKALSTLFVEAARGRVTNF